jgi:hypothetical protein
MLRNVHSVEREDKMMQPKNKTFISLFEKLDMALNSKPCFTKQKLIVIR